MFGANSGSLYLFERTSTAFLALVPSQLGVIGKVSISQSEKQIAIGNQSGSIGVLLELDPPNVREIISTELTLTSAEEQQLAPDAPRSPPSAFVTSFCWTEDDKELYCGDSRGIVSLIQFSLFMVNCRSPGRVPGSHSCRNIWHFTHFRVATYST